MCFLYACCDCLSLHNPPCSRRLQARRQRSKIGTLSTALATGDGSIRSGRSSRRHPPVPAQIAAPSEFEPDAIIENRIFDNLRLFVVIEDDSESEGEVKAEGGGNKSNTDRKRAYGMVAAWLCQKKLQRGQPLRHVWPSIMETIHASIRES